MPWCTIFYVKTPNHRLLRSSVCSKIDIPVLTYQKSEIHCRQRWPFHKQVISTEMSNKNTTYCISFQVDQPHSSAIQPQPQGFWAIMTMTLTHWEKPVSPLRLLSPFLTWWSCLYIGKLTIKSIANWPDQLLYDLFFGGITVDIKKGGRTQRAEDSIWRADWSLLY